MKKQTIMQESKYPSYVLLPWEEDEVISYAKRSHEKFKNLPDEKQRSEKDLILNARQGIGGELAFKNLLTTEKQSFIIEHTGGEGKYGAPYDFKVKGGDKEYTIDVKTSMKSIKVPTPEKCNFLWSLGTEVKKNNLEISLCDIYVQMFYDPDEFIYYFIGALSLEKIQQVRGGVRIGDNLGLIRQSEFDYTNMFLDFIDKRHKYETVSK